METVLSMVKSPDNESFDNQLDGLLSALSGLSVETNVDSRGSLDSSSSGSSLLGSDASSSVVQFSIDDQRDQAMADL